MVTMIVRKNILPAPDYLKILRFVRLPFLQFLFHNKVFNTYEIFTQALVQIVHKRILLNFLDKINPNANFIVSQ